MSLHSRVALVRNLSIAAVNGLLTYIILLIAPLGFAAVVINTALVTIASFTTATVADRIIGYLAGNDRSPAVRFGQRSSMRSTDVDDLDRP